MLGAIESGPLRIEYFRQIDRIAHRIHYEGQLIAESIEGNSLHNWPPSPPFQEVHIERTQLPGRESPCDVAFLVGMAGRSHWSASVYSIAQGEISCELACRLHAPPDWLGAGYRLPNAEAAAPTPLGAEQDAVGFSADHRTEMVLCDQQVLLSIAADGPIQVIEDEVTLRFPQVMEYFPQTARLNYRLAVRRNPVC